MRYTSVNDLPPQHRAEAERQLRGEPTRASVLIHAGNQATPAFCVDLSSPEPKKPSKYRNVRVELDGEKYDSRKEYEFHQLLKARLKAGEIGHILRQVTYRLEGNVRYRADFVCSVPNAPAPAIEIWDVKGFDTQSSINKRKQVLARYGVEVRLWPPREPKGRP